MAGDSNKAILAAFLANAGIAVAKFVGFVFTGSASMLAEGVHSVADTGNQALLFVGGRKAKKPPTPEHPFGYGRERYFWAFVVAVVLFTLGSAFATFEGVDKIRHPHEVESIGWAFGILGFGIVVEGLSFRTAIIEGRKMKGEAGWWEFIRRSRSPEIPVVLLEDLGALAGLVIALSAVSLVEITGEAAIDGWGTLAIGILLGVIAVILAIEMRSLLLGESASARDEKAIQRAIEGHDVVRSLIHLRTQHIGPDELLVGAKVEFAADLDTAALATAIDDLEVRLRDVVPTARVVYIEPDVRRPDHAR